MQPFDQSSRASDDGHAPSGNDVGFPLTNDFVVHSVCGALRRGLFRPRRGVPPAGTPFGSLGRDKGTQGPGRFRTRTVENSSGLNHNVSNVAALEIPAKLFGKQRLQAGDIVELEASLRTHCDAYRIDWTGRFTLRD